jgi:hypothetical protein
MDLEAYRLELGLVVQPMRFPEEQLKSLNTENIEGRRYQSGDHPRGIQGHIWSYTVDFLS